MMYRTGMPPQLFVGSRPHVRLLNPVRNYDNDYRIMGIMCKPIGGMWTSTLDRHGSDWTRWHGDIEWGGYVVYPLRRARVFEIDSISDYERLLNWYGYAPPMNPNGSHNDCWMVLNYEKLSKKCDGLHLTKKGQTETNYYIPRERRGLMPPMLNAWDCESTVWFRWAFSKKIDYVRGH